MKNGAELERNLKTPFEGDLSAWNIHPRPQLCREAWQTLCGLWRLSVKRRDTETDVGEITLEELEERIDRFEYLGNE